LQKLAGFARRRKIGIIAAVIALATVLLANYAWSYYSSQRDADAQARFSQVISAFNKIGTRSDKEGFERIIVEARKIKDEYGSSSVATLAQYYIAISEERLGNTDQAVQNLQDLIQHGDPMMKNLARFALGAIYKNHGDNRRAMESYKQLEESGAYSSKSESHSGSHSKAENPSAGHKTEGHQ
jgi:predicted negative regulator of RcsB-dependent stress response